MVVWWYLEVMMERVGFLAWCERVREREEEEERGTGAQGGVGDLKKGHV